MEEYNKEQLAQIQAGKDANLDISWYENPEFTWGQMMEIRKGLESDVDVSLYAKHNFTSEQMHQIRLGLEKGLNVKIYADPNLDDFKMLLIKSALIEGLNISNINFKDLTHEEIKTEFKERKNKMEESKQYENLNLLGNPKSVWIVSAGKNLSKLKF